jgi:hypothetical protein
VTFHSKKSHTSPNLGDFDCGEKQEWVVKLLLEPLKGEDGQRMNALNKIAYGEWAFPRLIEFGRGNAHRYPSVHRRRK